MDSKRYHWKWIKRTEPTEDGEFFVITQTYNRRKRFPIMNFWHVQKEHTSIYTFHPNAVFHRKLTWDEEMFRRLEADLRSPTPSVVVTRFVFDGNVVFNDGEPHVILPKMPRPKKHDYGWDIHLQKEARKADNIAEMKRRQEEKAARRAAAAIKEEMIKERKAAKRKRLEIEAEKCEVPAPYILFGKHDGLDKEYAWRLTPDKPKREGIVPGDRVLVWTRKGFKQVTVTRIEPADDKEQPTARVKKKLPPEEWVFKKPGLQKESEAEINN